MVRGCIPRSVIAVRDGKVVRCGEHIAVEGDSCPPAARYSGCSSGFVIFKKEPPRAAGPNTSAVRHRKTARSDTKPICDDSISQVTAVADSPRRTPLIGQDLW